MYSLKNVLLLALGALVTIQPATAEIKHIKNCNKPGDFALTFDDGPSDNEYTKMVLDVLKKENVKATFFVNGNNCIDVRSSPEAQKLIQRELDEGHIVASHTFTHPEDGITKLTDEQLIKEMTDLNDLLFELYKIKPAFFRPPLGESNEQNDKVLESLGFTANINWSLDSLDWDASQNATANYLYKLEKADSKKDNFIALNHDMQKVTATYNLELMIPIIRSYGYHFVTMDECIGMSAYQNINSLEGKTGDRSVNATAIAANTTTVAAKPTLVVPEQGNNLTSGAVSTQTITFVSAILFMSMALLNYF